MKKIEPKTLKGFRDFLPLEAKKRQYVIYTLKTVFESYGFEPLETPALEYEEILTGKYGDEGEKLMYRFEDLGGRKVAMRYDQTVPLARFVAQNQNALAFPFKRYQIQPVWRAENTQKGRFREFLQVDADIIGSTSPLSDSEIIALSLNCLERLGFKEFKTLVNDRKSVGEWLEKQGIEKEKLSAIFRKIDKIMKIGNDGVILELKKIVSEKQANEIIEGLKNLKPSESLRRIFDDLKKMDIEESKFKFDPYLARGLDYYNGIIFEMDVEGYTSGSVAGGGRYDNLIGVFTNQSIPAVGFSFGFDRLMEAMEEQKLFPDDLTVTKILLTNNENALEIAEILRAKGINTEVYLEKKDLEKQLKYADKKGIPFVVIFEGGKMILRNMKKREQKEVTLDEIIKKLT